MHNPLFHKSRVHSNGYDLCSSNIIDMTSTLIDIIFYLIYLVDCAIFAMPFCKPMIYSQRRCSDTMLILTTVITRVDLHFYILIYIDSHIHT